MSLRFNYRSENPESYETLIKLEGLMSRSGLDKNL